LQIAGVRVVLDTSAIVAGLRSRAGASRRLLSLALARRYELVLSVPLALEWEAVATRPEHLARAGVPAEDAVVVIDALIAVAEPVTLPARREPYSDDPDDDMVIATAVEGAADMIVTFNLRHIGDAARRAGIAAVVPSAALAQLEAAP
jgi:putative PIN family toxin of toxin-antitoxin system